MIRTSDVCVTERTPRNSLRLKPYGPIWNELTGDVSKQHTYTHPHTHTHTHMLAHMQTADSTAVPVWHCRCNLLSLELGIIGGLITMVHSLILSESLPIFHVRLDWLPLSCIALIWASQLSCIGSAIGRASAS